ncbi:hypothetical protein [Ructibacterium gallinarum]|uniref:Uncharacterized protein n=1 Tax=Ructibacterium gallinarum TaxID=2779355 RepID=A0A9D5M3U3_9FIRM|nr:hypothetical protein [Ructibacterium gallinarum]MBE5039049.1 hypothetical protein [Ructibacterium gallinarum]
MYGRIRRSLGKYVGKLIYLIKQIDIAFVKAGTLTCGKTGSLALEKKPCLYFCVAKQFSLHFS